ncbi:helix-turn-helix transcriptional regulator [Vibrio sp. 99-70-13A1]|uniref:helix-turn-helix domain-containing protein n=1 Tax=Vibrio sp. 99-70-13A1 TaxID=2607601 RepID=UPI001493BFAD|nr:helix-turn-helix transcriptional regulator [Vibrio sp. 99-70-13A1]NOH98258.1 helix-turn-helix transcriptional regulator [Vibrio sp. 99-70-13A1]
MKNNAYEVPVIQTDYAKILVQVFSEYGFDLHQLLMESGLPSDLFQTESDFVPSESIKRLIFLTSSQLGITQFTDVLALSFRQRIIPNVLHQFVDYETIGDALMNIDTIFKNDSPGSKIEFTEEHGQHWFTRNANYVDSPSFAWSEAFAIIYIKELIQILTRTQWHPTKIKLHSKQVDVVKSIAPSNCQLFIEQGKTSVYIPKNILDLPIQLSSKELSTKPSIIEWHTSFTDSIFELLKPYVNEQNLSIEQAAEILNFSVRTLQRKLKSENTSFRKVKESLMYSAACELMEKGHSLTYISTQLGYSNISHFSRAFKRVSGLTPKIYQRSIAPPPPMT